MATVKEEARELVERLADEASWDDLMYQIYVRKKIAMGLEAAEAGKLIPHDEVKRTSKEMTILDRTRVSMIRQHAPPL